MSSDTAKGFSSELYFDESQLHYFDALSVRKTLKVEHSLPSDFNSSDYVIEPCTFDSENEWD